MTPTLRRATARVSAEAAPLVLDAIPSLEVVLGDRTIALRGCEACYLGERTEFAHRFGLIAEVEGRVAGLAIAFPSRLLTSLKLGTGVVLARAVGPRHVGDLANRARVLNRLLPPVARDSLYLSCIAVGAEHRRTGIASGLMERVIAGARRLGLRLALHTAMGEEGRPFYERFGFRVTASIEASETERRLVPVEGMLRMDRPPD